MGAIPSLVAPIPHDRDNHLLVDLVLREDLLEAVRQPEEVAALGDPALQQPRLEVVDRCLEKTTRLVASSSQGSSVALDGTRSAERLHKASTYSERLQLLLW